MSLSRSLLTLLNVRQEIARPSNYSTAGNVIATQSGDKARFDLVSAFGLAGEVAISAAATAAAGFVNVCSGTAPYAVTLPPVATSAGAVIGFRMAPSLSGMVAITGNASEAIDGLNVRRMYAGETAYLACNGANWNKIGGRSIPMLCSMYLPNWQTVGSYAITVVDCTATAVDNSGVMANTTSKVIITGRTGTFLFTGNCTFANPGVVDRCLVQGYVNGGQVVSAECPSAADSYSNPYFAKILQLNAGDVVHLAALQSSSSDKSLYGSSAQTTGMSLSEIPSW